MDFSVRKIRVTIATLLLLAATTTDSLAGEAQGVLQWDLRTQLSLPVSGVVKEVLVSRGQMVKQGQVMIRLDARRVEARQRAAQARVSRHQPGRDEAKRELQRAQELYDRTALSQVELDQAKNDYAEKNAALQEAYADVMEAKLNLEYSELKAPFDLIVLNVHVATGQAIINRMQAVPLVDVAGNKLAVVVSIRPENIAGAKPGLPVKVEYAGNKLNGTISTIDYDANQQRTIMYVQLKDHAGVKPVAGYPVGVTWH